MTTVRKFLRSNKGNAFLPIVAFLITGTLAISSLTGFTQFLTVKNKIDQSLIEGERAGLVFISDNLTNSSILQNPAQANVILNNARTIAIGRAVASLGEPTRLMLIDRNGPELTRLYQNEATRFEISSGGDKVKIQLGISTNVLGAVPFRYSKKTPLREIRPSDIDNIITTPSIECNATNDCGACGICDQSVGECIPNLFVVAPGGNSNIGPFKEPANNPDAQGKFACKDFDDTVPGEFCTDDAGGTTFISTNGQEGCNEVGCTGPDCPDNGPGVDPGDPDPDPDGFDCKFVDNFNAWNIIGDPSTGNIKVYWDGAVIDTTGFTAADTTFTDPNGDTYTRSTLFPFGINQDDPGNDTYALCKGDLVPPGPPPLDPANSGRRVFVTQETYTGNLVQEANTRFGTSFSNSESRAAANFLCDSAANAGGLSGTSNWLALLGYTNPGAHFNDIAPPGGSDFKYYRVRSNQTGQHDILGGDWNGNVLMYSVRDYRPLEVTQFGNHLSDSYEKGIWGGYYMMENNISLRGTTAPASRTNHVRRGDLSWAGNRGNQTSTCANWTSSNHWDSAWFGLHIRSGAYNYGQWAHWVHMAHSCDSQLHLYCVESQTTDIRNW